VREFGSRQLIINPASAQILIIAAGFKLSLLSAKSQSAIERSPQSYFLNYNSGCSQIGNLKSGEAQMVSSQSRIGIIGAGQGLSVAVKQASKWMI
jgi:hypothetical protein